jgi:hypothetical protein
MATRAAPDEIEMVVPFGPEEILARVHANADRYRYNPFTLSRAAGSRDFIHQDRDGAIAVTRRRHWPDMYGLEAAIRVEPLTSRSTRIRVRLQVPRASRVVNAFFLSSSGACRCARSPRQLA